jgi:hypothetical protein
LATPARSIMRSMPTVWMPPSENSSLNRLAIGRPPPPNSQAAARQRRSGVASHPFIESIGRLRPRGSALGRLRRVATGRRCSGFPSQRGSQAPIAPASAWVGRHAAIRTSTRGHRRLRFKRSSGVSCDFVRRSDEDRHRGISIVKMAADRQMPCSAGSVTTGKSSHRDERRSHRSRNPQRSHLCTICELPCTRPTIVRGAMVLAEVGDGLEVRGQARGDNAPLTWMVRE